MTDLTKIEKPFGLLDAETQEALRAHGGPWQYWFPEDGWRDFKGQEPAWDGGTVYRVKPQPPKPRDGWCYLTHMFATEEAARGFRARVAAEHGGDHLQNPITHWVEVLPE